EGYVRATVVNGTTAYSYVYNYTDHLGNIRLSYAMDPQSPNGLKILEENHYYPFGLKHTNYNSNVLVHREDAGALKIKDPDFPKPSAPILPYNYKYNGKEFQEEMGLNLYDYGARNYDPAIGRWMDIDPLAETSRRFSPYTYVLNNPIYFIDPDGMEAKYNWEEHDKGNKGIYIDNGKQVSWQEALADYGIYANDNSGVTPFSTTDLFALAASHGIIDKKEAGNAFERATLNYLNLPSNKELFESSERKLKLMVNIEMYNQMQYLI
ncbi:MAG: RHS repeat-associated core domain-containing protein, partial [Flavobacterium johnsoniae]